MKNSISRNITFSEVTVTKPNEEKEVFTVFGETTPMKEIKKLFKKAEYEDIPIVKVVVKTEKREISLEDFLKYSTIITEKTTNESEEN